MRNTVLISLYLEFGINLLASLTPANVRSLKKKKMLFI